MRKLFNKILVVTLITISLSCSSICFGGEVKISMRLAPEHSKKVTTAEIVILDKSYPIILNENGEGDVTIHLTENTFAQLIFGKMATNLYLQSGKDVELTFINDRDWRGDLMEVTCDDGGINQFLRKHSARTFSIASSTSFDLKEDKFLLSVEQIIKGLNEYTENAAIPQNLKPILKDAARFEVLNEIFKYPRFHRYGEKLSKEYYDSFVKFNTYIFNSYVENRDYLNITSYRRFITNWVFELMQLRCHGESLLYKNENACHYILENTKDDQLKEYFLHTTIVPYIKKESPTGADTLISIYKRNVKTPIYTISFQNEYDKWKDAMPGKKAFDFRYPDFNGNEVRLSDFKGKAVFIDVWATWCAPCCHEIPFVKALEEKYKDKNIVFISLSTDKDEDAWKKMVKSQKMEGIQLNIHKNRDFMKSLNITSIPRFIIIDKEGNLVNAVAPKPSSGKVDTILDNLDL